MTQPTWSRRGVLQVFKRLAVGAPAAGLVACLEPLPGLYPPECEGNSPAYWPFTDDEGSDTPTIAQAFPEIFLAITESFHGDTSEHIHFTIPEHRSPGFGYDEAKKRLITYIKAWGQERGYCDEDHECRGFASRSEPPSFNLFNRTLIMTDISDPTVEAYMGGETYRTATHLQSEACLFAEYHGIIAIKTYKNMFGEPTINLLLLTRHDHGLPHLVDALTRIHEPHYQQALDAHVVGIAGPRLTPEVVRLID